MVKKLKKNFDFSIDDNISNESKDEIKTLDINVFDDSEIIDDKIDIDKNIDENLISRFIKKSDDNNDVFVWKINHQWWSRPFEYQWCKSLIPKDKDSVVLDAGCGLVHPFRFVLAQESNNVYACDLNSNIANLMGVADRIKAEHGTLAYIDFIKHQDLFKKIHHSICNISKTNYQDKFFDDIFCISTLEHLEENEINNTLQEFNRILKDNGRLIITLDIPNQLDNLGMFKFNNLDALLEIINKNNFKAISDIDISRDDDILECNNKDNPYNVDINVFRLVLVKNI